MMATHHHKVGGAAALPLALIGQAIPMLTRHDLEALTERLIDRLDEIASDPDLEDDDPSGQCDEDGQNTGYGRKTPPEQLAELMPQYGADQSTGPTNFNAAYKEWWKREFGTR